MGHLKDEGYAVASGVASSIQVEEARKLVWDWLEGLGTGIKQEEQSTWQDEAWPDWPGMKKYGTCKSDGAAHKGATWYLRGLPNLKKSICNNLQHRELNCFNGWHDSVEAMGGDGI